MCHGVIGLPPALLGPTPTPTHTRARVPLMHAFVPPRPLQGFTTAQKLDKLGMRGSDTCELLFENCEVPEENVLGRESQVGWAAGTHSGVWEGTWPQSQLATTATVGCGRVGAAACKRDVHLYQPSSAIAYMFIVGRAFMC